MKTKHLFILSAIILSMIGNIHSYASGFQIISEESDDIVNVEESIDNQQYKLKREYDFSSLVTNKSGIELTCGTAIVDIEGVTCYKSSYPGYEGLFFQEPFNFRESALRYLGSKTVLWGINDLTEGSKVTIAVSYVGANGLNLIDNGVGELISENLIENEHTNDSLIFMIKKDGDLAISVGAW